MTNFKNSMKGEEKEMKAKRKAQSKDWSRARKGEKEKEIKRRRAAEPCLMKEDPNAPKPKKGEEPVMIQVPNVPCFKCRHLLKEGDGQYFCTEHHPIVVGIDNGGESVVSYTDGHAPIGDMPVLWSEGRMHGCPWGTERTLGA